MRRATGDLSPLSVLGRVPSYPGSDGAAPDLLLRRLDSNSSVATSEASSMLDRSASMRDSHGDMIAPVSRTSSLQHARRAYQDDGRNGDSSVEHTPPRVMRSVSAPGSGVKDDASTRSISSDTVRRLLDVPGLDSRRRRPPQEVANEQQARDLDIPAGVNVQRSASPGEIHRRVRDERMTQRLRQYEEHEAYQRSQRERHLRRQARRLAKAEGRSLESSPSGVSIGSTACSSDPGSSPASPRIVGPEASPGQNGRAADAADGGLFGEYAHVLDAKDLQEMAEDNKLMEERVDVLIRELRIWQTRLDISAVRTRGAIAATQDMLAAETARARTDIAAICDKSDRAVIKGVGKISDKVEAVRLPTLGGIEEEALWGEAAQPPAGVPRLPLASVREGQAGLPAASAASADQHLQQQQQPPQQAGKQQAATVQRDSDDSLRSWSRADEASAAQPGGHRPVSTGKRSFTFAQAPLRT